MIREKGKLSIRDALKERDHDLWEKLEEVWNKAGPTHEAIERAKDKLSAMPHSVAVEENLSALIPDDGKQEKLQPVELFSLSAAACLHDADKGWGTLKRVHGEVSAGEIRAHFAEYGLGRRQADIVGWIIKVHDHGDLRLLDDTLAMGALDIELRSLAALFKLADILHSDYRRVDDPESDDPKDRARLCIGGWIYDAEGRIRFQAVPEKVSDLEHICKAIAMMKTDIEPIAPILREAGYPYEFTTQIDESKLIYPVQEKRRSGRSFIGMDFFYEDDQHLFKGRKRESEELYGLLQAGDPVVALVGDSGVGKTSLIRAGLFPILRKTGNWKFVYTRPLSDPASDVIREIWLRIAESDPPEDTDLIKTFEHISDENWDSTLLIVMDQFEDIFRSPTGLEQIQKALCRVQGKSSFYNLRVLLSYRADAEGQVGPMLQGVALSFRSLSRMYLEALDRDGARKALEAGFGAAQVGLDPDVGADEFMKLILDDIEAQGRGFYPPYIQMVGETLCDKAKSKIISKSIYNSSGRAGGIIGNYLFNQLDSFGDRRGDAERILVELTSVVSPEGRKAWTKSVEDLERDLGVEREALDELLRWMIDKRMIRRSDDGKYEIIHDHLAELVDRNLIAAGEEREFKKFREHLASAAATYSSTGLLLEPVVMARLYQHREQINPSPTEKAILLHSCLAGNGPAWYWFREVPPDELLPEIPQHEESHVWIAAVEELVKLVTQGNIPGLMEMLMNTDRNVRIAAAKALLELVTQDNIPELEEMLINTDRNVRIAAKEALVKVVTQDNIPELMGMQMNGNRDVRIAAVEALVKLGVSIALPEFMEMLRYGDIRIAASEAPGSLGSAEEFPSLLNIVVSGGEGASEAKDALIRIDRRIYCPFDWPEEER